MAAVNKQRQPPLGYPTGGQAKEEEARQVVDNKNDQAQQTNDEDDSETDRGISARLTFGRSNPWPREDYPGPGFAPPRVPHSRVGNPNGYPAPHGYGSHSHKPGHGSHEYQQRVEYGKPGHGSHTYQQRVEYEVSDEEDGYEGGYGHQPTPRKPQQYYRHETFVDQPPPPRRRPQGSYYVRDEYTEY